MKIGQIYDLNAFENFLKSSDKRAFGDATAGAGVILARNLTAIDPKIFEKKYPELTFVNSGVGVDNTGGYVERVQSLRLVDMGGFSTAGDLSGNKGKISLTAEDSYIKVYEREAFSKWTDTEIKQAELQGVNLPSRYIETHNKRYLREIDQIGYLGIETNKGLLNFAGFGATAAGGAIGTLTAQQMYDAFADLITSQWNAVYNTPEYKANRVDMAVSVYNVIANTMMDTSAGTATVLKALQDNFAGVMFNGTVRAESSNFTSGGSRTIAYCNTEDSMIMRIPLALTIGEIIKLGSFDYHVDSKYRIAGLDVLENTSAKILTGL